MNKLEQYFDLVTKAKYLSEEGRNSKFCEDMISFISNEDLHMYNFVPVMDLSGDPIYRILNAIAEKINAITIRIINRSRELLEEDKANRRNLDPELSSNRRIYNRERKLDRIEKNFITGSSVDIPDLVSTFSARRERGYSETLEIVWREAKLEDIINFMHFRDIFSESDHYYLETSNTPFNGSIVGGYTRNILLGIKDKSTDIDITFSERSTIWKAIFNRFCDYNSKRKSKASQEYRIKEGLISFSGVTLTEEEKDYIIGNKIHCMYKINSRISYLCKRSNNNLEGVKENMNGTTDLTKNIVRDYDFLECSVFDFTINCACLSLNDGMLYATPITLYDLQNRIVRNCFEVYKNGQSPNEGLLIRALRFAHKYNMSIDNNSYRRLCVNLKTVSSLDAVNILNIHTALKGVMNDDTNIKNAVYKNMKELNFYATDKFNNIESYFEFLELILPKYVSASSDGNTVAGLIKSMGFDMGDY